MSEIILDSIVKVAIIGWLAYSFTEWAKDSKKMLEEKKRSEDRL